MVKFVHLLKIARHPVLATNLEREKQLARMPCRLTQNRNIEKILKSSEGDKRQQLTVSISHHSQCRQYIS